MWRPRPSGSTFPVGTTSVTCEATDAAGNRAEGSFDVTVGPFACVVDAQLHPTSGIRLSQLLTVDASASSDTCGRDLRYFWTCASVTSLTECPLFLGGRAWVSDTTLPGANANGNTQPVAYLLMLEGDVFLIGLTVCAADPDGNTVDCAPTLSRRYEGAQV